MDFRQKRLREESQLQDSDWIVWEEKAEGKNTGDRSQESGGQGAGGRIQESGGEEGRQETEDRRQKAEGKNTGDRIQEIEQKNTRVTSLSFLSSGAFLSSPPSPSSPSSPLTHSPTHSLVSPIMEATGWVQTADGRVYLVADAPNGGIAGPWLPMLDCIYRRRSLSDESIGE